MEKRRAKKRVYELGWSRTRDIHAGSTGNTAGDPNLSKKFPQGGKMPLPFVG